MTYRQLFEISFNKVFGSKRKNFYIPCLFHVGQTWYSVICLSISDKKSHNNYSYKKFETEFRNSGQNTREPGFPEPTFLKPGGKLHCILWWENNFITIINPKNFSLGLVTRPNPYTTKCDQAWGNPFNHIKCIYAGENH